MVFIISDKKYFFEKLKDDEWIFHDLDYDFNSITHYDLFKYSANGRPTIQLKVLFSNVNIYFVLEKTPGTTIAKSCSILFSCLFVLYLFQTT